MTLWLIAHYNFSLGKGFLSVTYPFFSCNIDFSIFTTEAQRTRELRKSLKTHLITFISLLHQILYLKHSPIVIACICQT